VEAAREIERRAIAFDPRASTYLELARSAERASRPNLARHILRSGLAAIPADQSGELALELRRLGSTDR
jgi:hypothetical protein